MRPHAYLPTSLIIYLCENIADILLDAWTEFGAAAWKGFPRLSFEPRHSFWCGQRNAGNETIDFWLIEFSFTCFVQMKSDENDIQTQRRSKTFKSIYFWWVYKIVLSDFSTSLGDVRFIFIHEFLVLANIVH